LRIPVSELVLGYKKSNQSPVLQLLFSRWEELIARVKLGMHPGKLNLTSRTMWIELQDRRCSHVRQPRTSHRAGASRLGDHTASQADYLRFARYVLLLVVAPVSRARRYASTSFLPSCLAHPAGVACHIVSFACNDAPYSTSRRTISSWPAAAA
jgi:hypothetical protein